MIDKKKLYIKYLVEVLGWRRTHLGNFMHKYYHKFNIDRLTKKEAIKLIESLKAVSEHQRNSSPLKL